MIPKVEEPAIHRRVDADPPRMPAGWRGGAATLLLFVALAVFHTWPLASSPGTLARHDNGDAILNEWIVAWVAHQLPRDPLRLFDANIFHPEPNTLAFSEHLFFQAVLGSPLSWGGVSSTVVHNVLIIAGLALTGWAMCLVMRRWTGDWWAAVLAGMLFAFNSHSLTRLAHVQAQHAMFLPVAVYALDRLLRTRRLRDALLLAAAFSLQSLASKYLFVFLSFALVAAVLVRPREWTGSAGYRTIGLLALAAALSALVLSPFLIHYLQAHRAQGLTRSVAQIADYGAAWSDYLMTGGRLHFESWSARFWRRDATALFPGFTALLLSIVALVTSAAIPRPALRMWLAIGVTGGILSFGVAVPGYTLLYQVIPLLQGIRTPARFGFLLLAAIAVLAGCGLASLRRSHLRRPGWRAGVSVAALVLVTAEAARLPVGYEPAYRVPGIYRLLATEGAGAVVELPLYQTRHFFYNAQYMLNSTLHWRPLLNGYSGFFPESYVRHWEALRGFPNPTALAYLRELEVTHVVIHARQFADDEGEDALHRVTATPALRVVASVPNVTVYRLAGAGE